jgi:hypothetical protein
VSRVAAKPAVFLFPRLLTNALWHMIPGHFLCDGLAGTPQDLHDASQTQRIESD